MKDNLMWIEFVKAGLSSSDLTIEEITRNADECVNEYNDRYGPKAKEVQNIPHAHLRENLFEDVKTRLHVMGYVLENVKWEPGKDTSIQFAGVFLYRKRGDNYISELGLVFTKGLIKEPIECGKYIVVRLIDRYNK